jgi:hypothetical protein
VNPPQQPGRQPDGLFVVGADRQTLDGGRVPLKSVGLLPPLVVNIRICDTIRQVFPCGPASLFADAFLVQPFQGGVLTRFKDRLYLFMRAFRLRVLVSGKPVWTLSLVWRESSRPFATDFGGFSRLRRGQPGGRKPWARGAAVGLDGREST